MRILHIAALLVSVSCILLTASCLESTAADPYASPEEMYQAHELEPIGEARQETGPAYGSKDFPFVEIVKDDGEGKGGGWQQADKTFSFIERDMLLPVYFWQCRIRIEMPIRSQRAGGRISPSRAALYSAEVANAVVDPLLASRPAWRNQGASFCIQLRAKMETTFRQRYPEVGAKVKLNP